MNAHFPIAVVVALGLLVAPGNATAQDTPRARAQSTLSGDLFTRVDALARAAEEEGIPGDILFNKALEGSAKHVPADRIVPAVQAYAGRLREARTAFGPGTGAPLLIAGADALQRGVGADLLGALGKNPDRSPTACLALADLVEAGVAGDQALGLVREAMRLRNRDQEVLDVSAQVRRLMRQGASATNAVEQVRRSLQRGRGGGVSPPVAPGSEPTTQTRRRGGGGE